MSTTPASDVGIEGVNLEVIHGKDPYPDWMTEQELAEFLHHNMKPYEDTIEDILSALDYARSDAEGKGGFILIAEKDHDILGALVMLETGMGGYVPEHILLFVGVRPDLRGKGVGGWLVREGIARCKGKVKLHVEYDNPAKRLYERVGFTTKYAEMRVPAGGK